jgi:hypothetical protein
MTSSPRRVFSLPEGATQRIEALLQGLGFTVERPRDLAKVIERLSDHYTQRAGEPTPWAESWVRAASLAYYYPLNYARARAVAVEAERLGFFEGLTTLIDYGSGAASALHAFQESNHAFDRAYALDVSSTALEFGAKLGGSDPATPILASGNGRGRPTQLRDRDPRSTLVLASYAYAELEDAPPWWLDTEALAIIEPSTQAGGRRLMELRQKLIEQGFQIWAPCTHQGPCPLLTHSAKDWCHDRIHWSPPTWMAETERFLPMKNRTLTFSYLLARKSPAPQTLSRLARLTGDTLEEKGKSRQSVCRGTEREFLSWFPERMAKAKLGSIELDRGVLVQLREDLELKGSEIRMPAPDAVRALDPGAKPDFES